jgi:rhodanese-related sulfurtransferase/DNA-directed RNA polymerase subunit RPC12/RpoP
MTTGIKRSFGAVAVISLLFIAFTSGKYIGNKQDGYVCLPCGSDCDAEVHKGPGTCSRCSMALVKKSTIKHKNIEPKDLCSFITKAGSGNVLLLDVRTAAEFEGRTEEKSGRLNNAVNIPIQELETRMKELSDWKDKQVVVYCSHSHRSPRASYMLSQNGFKNVTNMLGGMSTWKTSVKDENCNRQLFISQ